MSNGLREKQWPSLDELPREPPVSWTVRFILRCQASSEVPKMMCDFKMNIGCLARPTESDSSPAQPPQIREWATPGARKNMAAAMLSWWLNHRPGQNMPVIGHHPISTSKDGNWKDVRNVQPATSTNIFQYQPVRVPQRRLATQVWPTPSCFEAQAKSGCLIFN